jgi:hypothetical protein
VALRPQPPAPQFFERPVEAVPLRGLWTGAVAAALLVAVFLGGVFKEIAAHWRGIVLAHIFFLTLWLALQVFFFATGAYWCFPSESPKWVEGLSKYFPRISRCVPTVSSHASLESPGSLAVSPLGSPTASPPASPSASSPSVSSPPPAVPSPGSRMVPSFSSATAANCWRDRSVRGNCFARTESYRKLSPHRFRSLGPSASPCRRSYNCWSDAI